MARKTNLTLLLSHEERQTLESWQRSTTIRAGWAQRGRIILLLSKGVPISEDLSEGWHPSKIHLQMGQAFPRETALWALR